MSTQILFFALLVILGKAQSLLGFSDENEESDNIRGIVLVDSEERLLNREELQCVEGLDVERIDLPGSVCLLQKKLQHLYSQPWNEETLQDIKQEIYRYYQHQEHPFVLISIPSQDRSSRVLQLVVIESRMGTIHIVGNTGISRERFLRYFKTLPGDPLDQRRIDKDLRFMNRDPFRRVNAVFSPGTETYTTDVTLQVNVRKPYRFYAGVDNSGVLPTGRQRIFAGFSWDQVFNLDHSFFYQYTTNYNVRRFHSNTFQYIARLPCEMVVNAYGGFSIVHANIASPNRTNHGTNIQGSLRLQIPFLPVRSFEQETSVGFDLKNTNNTMEFVDFIPVFGHTVNVFQFALGYRCKWDTPLSIAEMGGELFVAPAQWLPNQTSADFASLRPGANTKWARLTAFLNYKRSLPRSCSYTLFASGQWTGQSLLPSEQLCLGGYTSVRGYDERQYNADSGFMASGEFHSPTFSVIRSKSPHPDKMYFLLFLDGGLGWDTTAVPGVRRQNFLIGTGPGIRYSFGPYLTARCDWGIKLRRQSDFTGGSSMLHFSVVGSY